MNKRQKKKFEKKFKRKKYHKLNMYILPVDYRDGTIMITCQRKCTILGYQFIDLDEYIKTNGKSFTCNINKMDTDKVDKCIKWYIDNFYKRNNQVVRYKVLK